MMFFSKMRSLKVKNMQRLGTEASACYCHSPLVKVKRMQRPGTEAIRTQTQPSNPKREITNITNSQNTKRTYGQPSEQLFPKKGGHSAAETELKII